MQQKGEKQTQSVILDSFVAAIIVSSQNAARAFSFNQVLPS